MGLLNRDWHFAGTVSVGTTSTSNSAILLVDGNTETTDITYTGGLQLARTYTGPTQQVGEIRWDSGNGVPNVILTGGNVDLQLGSENVVRVFNNSGVALVDGDLVYVSGSQGNRPAVKKADATNETTQNVFGMVTEPIAFLAEGFVTTFGMVNGLNTSGLTAGMPIFLSNTPGTYTQNPLDAPYHSNLIGWCVRKHAAAGSIFVKPETGYELGELHDVKNYVTSSMTTGQYLAWSATHSWWEVVSGPIGSSGTSGVSGSSGTSGISGSSGTSGVDGSSGTSGISGSSGTSGIDGSSGTSGLSGVNGLNGSSGTSGIDGSSGTSGIDGSSGTSGIDGSSGTSGFTGSSGTSGTSPAGGGSVTLNNNVNNYIATMTGTSSTLDGEPDLIFDATTSTLYQDINVNGLSYSNPPIFGISSLIDFRTGNTGASYIMDTGFGQYSGEVIRANYDLTIASGQSSILFGQILYLTKNGAGDPVWDLASAHNGLATPNPTAESTHMLGVAVESTSSNTGEVNILLKGWLIPEKSSTPNIAYDYGSSGNPLYLLSGTNSGSAAQWGGAVYDPSFSPTGPYFQTSGDTKRIVGYTLRETILIGGVVVNAPIIRFDPDQYWTNFV